MTNDRAIFLLKHARMAFVLVFLLLWFSGGGPMLFDATEKLTGDYGRGAMLAVLFIGLLGAGVHMLIERALKKRMGVNAYLSWANNSRSDMWLSLIIVGSCVYFMLGDNLLSEDFAFGDVWFIALMVAMVLVPAAFVLGQNYLKKRMTADSFAKMNRRCAIISVIVLAVMMILVFGGFVDLYPKF